MHPLVFLGIGYSSSLYALNFIIPLIHAWPHTNKHVYTGSGRCTSHNHRSQPERLERAHLCSITFKHSIQTQKNTGLCLSLSLLHSPPSLSISLSLRMSVSLPLRVSLSFSLGKGVLWGIGKASGDLS